MLDPAAWKRLDELVGRRLTGEPVAYLLGTAWFYGREFEVDRRVLVPRPETELLVELALTHFADHATSSTFVDACTGSGCVAVSIAAELDGRARVVATACPFCALMLGGETGPGDIAVRDVAELLWESQPAGTAAGEAPRPERA